MFWNSFMEEIMNLSFFTLLQKDIGTYWTNLFFNRTKYSNWLKFFWKSTRTPLSVLFNLFLRIFSISTDSVLKPMLYLPSNLIPPPTKLWDNLRSIRQPPIYQTTCNPSINLRSVRQPVISIRQTHSLVRGVMPPFF